MPRICLRPSNPAGARDPFGGIKWPECEGNHYYQHQYQHQHQHQNDVLQEWEGNMSGSLPPRSPYASVACCWDAMQTFPYLEIKGCGLEGVDFDGDDDGNENKTEVGEAWNIEDDIDDSNDKDGKLHFYKKNCDIRKHSTCCKTCESCRMSYSECIALTTPLHSWAFRFLQPFLITLLHHSYCKHNRSLNKAVCDV